MISKRILLSALVFLSATVLDLRAQNDVVEEVKPPSKNAKVEAPGVVAALEWLSGNGWAAKGSAEIRNGKGGGSAMMMMPGRSPEKKPFKGSMDVMRSAKGELLVNSESGLPGMAVYRSGKKTFTRQTVALGKERDLGKLGKDLGPLMDLAKTAAWAKADSKWRVATHEDTGNKTYTSLIPLRLVGAREEEDEDGGMPGMNMMEVKVIDAKLSVTLGPKDVLQTIVIKVVRSDPMAMLQELAQESGGQINPMDLADMEPIEGPTNVYRFDFKNEEASKRAKALLGEFRKLKG